MNQPSNRSWSLLCLPECAPCDPVPTQPMPQPVSVLVQECVMHAGRAPSRCREGGGPAAAACSSVAAAGASVSPLRASSPAARNWCCSAPLPSAPPPWAEAASGPSASCVHALPPLLNSLFPPPGSLRTSRGGWIASTKPRSPLCLITDNILWCLIQCLLEELLPQSCII